MEKARTLIRQYNKWQMDIAESGELINPKEAILIENEFLRKIKEAFESGN